jgi:heme A synthase
MLAPVSAIHSSWGEIAAGISGVVGLWGILMARRSTVPKAFYWAVAFAIANLLFQVVLGVWAMSLENIDPGNQHVFYGVVIAITFAFVYIYRAQFRKRPALYYGLVLLFTMGLAIRGIMTFGQSF